jgi:thioredoxin 1
MKSYLLILAVLFPIIFSGCKGGNKTGNTEAKSEGAFVTVLTNETFKTLVFDYEKNKEFKFEGKMPVIIDFYADWCAPCRQLSPLVESIAKEYSGKINVYKVDTEKEKLLAQNLGISGLPTLLFIPAEGMPRSSLGLISREDMIKAVNEILLIK